MLERIANAYINLARTKHFRRRKAFRFRFAVLLLLRLLMHWGENMVESLEKRFIGGTSKIARIFKSIFAIPKIMQQYILKSEVQ